MTEPTFTAADVTRLRELMQPPRIVPAEGFPPVRLVGDVQLAEALCIAYRIALPLADALTAERQKVTALREELNNIAVINWQSWSEEVRSADEFVNWAKSRANYALTLTGDDAPAHTPATELQ